MSDLQRSLLREGLQAYNVRRWMSLASYLIRVVSG